MPGGLAPRSGRVIAHSNASVARSVDVELVVRSPLLLLGGRRGVALRCNGRLIDFVGDVDSYSGSAWRVAGVVGALDASLLSRRAFVQRAQSLWRVAAGTSPLDSEWIVTQPAKEPAWLAPRSSSGGDASRNCHLFISVYAEGRVKAIELFNAADRPLSLASLALLRLTNGGRFANDSTRYALGSGKLDARQRLLLLPSTATRDLLPSLKSKLVGSSIVYISGLSRMNGNDAIALSCDNTIVDQVGAEGCEKIIIF